MIELDGRSYSIKTPDENTQDLIDRVNTYCQNNNIQNSRGDVIFIETNFASPLYLLFWSCGYLATIIQNLLYSLGTMTSIASSTDAQLLNLAEIAGLTRKPATRTTITCFVYTENLLGDTNIPVDLSVTIRLNNQTIIFYPMLPVIIPEDSYAMVILQANILGSFIISAGTITAFDTPIPSIKKIVSNQSVPGQEEESIASLRTRMSNRANNITGVDKTIQDLAALEGITSCNIFYNYSNTEPVTIDGISVEPRRSLVYIQGYNSEIASTYYNNMAVLTTETPSAIKQDTTLLNGQTVSVFFVPPKLLGIQINLFIGQEYSASDIRLIAEYIVQLTASLSIATPVSVKMVLDSIPSLYNVQGAEISINNTDWDQVVIPEPNELITIAFDNIHTIRR